MKRKAGKIIVLVLAAVFVLSVAACGSQDTGDGNGEGSSGARVTGNTTPEAEQPEYVIDYYNSIGATQEIPRSDTTKVGAIIKEKFNIVFNVHLVAGDYLEKSALMLAAGDYPDLVGILDIQGMAKKYVDAGALVKLDELVDQYAPNFKELHKESIPVWRMTSDDGGLYKYEFYNPNHVLLTGAQNDIIVRSDLLEAQGWPKVSSADSYYEFIREALKNSPETAGEKNLGLIMPAGEAMAWPNLYATFIPKGGPCVAKGIVSYHIEKQIAESIFDNPSFKESLVFLNKLYKEGLLDPECFTDKQQQVQDKLNRGKAVAALFVKFMSDVANTELRKNGKANMEYMPMDIRSDSQADEKAARYLPVIGSYPSCSVAITKNAKYPERIVQLLDWAATEEGQAVLGWGIEGVHYTVDKDGQRILTDDFKKGYSSDPNYLFKEGITAFDFLGLTAAPGKNGQINLCTLDPSFTSSTLSDRTKEALGKYGWDTLVDTWKKNSYDTRTYNNTVVNAVSLDPAGDEGKTEAKIKELFLQNIPAVIMAKDDSEFNSLWEKLSSDANSLGYDKVIAKYNTAFKEYAQKVEGLKTAK